MKEIEQIIEGMEAWKDFNKEYPSLGSPEVIATVIAYHVRKRLGANNAMEFQAMFNDGPGKASTYEYTVAIVVDEAEKYIRVLHHTAEQFATGL